MPWTSHPNKISETLECLRDDKGNFVGFVIRFNGGDVVHAWTEHEKIGQAKTIGQAKDLVEERMA